MEISPKYLMKLIVQIEKTIWDEFSSYKNVNNYIKKWHECNDAFNISDYWENFVIIQNSGNINLNETLHNMPAEIIIKIAVDMGIETPDFIPSVPIIKNVLKENYSASFNSFEKALKEVEENPDLAIGSANSTLESIIKHILANDNIQIECNTRKTLFDLTQSILKEFSLFPGKNVPKEIRDIGNGLLKVSKNIETLRSEKTTFHGKTKEDYIVDDPLYAYFIVNSVSTIGLFLMSFYEKYYNKRDLLKKEKEELQSSFDTTIDPADLPF